MVQKILIFKIFIIFIFININNLNAKTIIGKSRIIDGDTIYINTNKIRLHGIDAPERKQKCTYEENEWDCGKQSVIELKKLIKDQAIRCITTDIDIYNRYVANCFINEVNINQLMVRLGWALAYRYYSLDYIQEEKYARKNKLGIWKGEFEEPYLFRKRNK